MILVTACYPIESRWIEPRPDLQLVRTRVGERAPERLDALEPDLQDASVLIASGFCGAAAPELRTGDLFLARTIRHGEQEILIDAGLLDTARRALAADAVAFHVGPCVSSDHVVDTAEKRALAEQGICAIDMESGPLARWAIDRQVPLLVLRVVLDTFDDEIPFSADHPTWCAALRHPMACMRTARAAIDAARSLGHAIGVTAESLRRRQDV